MTERNVHVVAHGEGPAVLFTAGWLNGLTIWDGIVEELRVVARCIRWDLPGQGQSPAVGRGNYTRDLILEDLRHVIETEAPDEPVFLVGHSFGGYLSLAYAIEFPEHVAGLGLVAAGPGFRNPDSMEQWNESVRRTAAKTDGLPNGQEEISMHFDSMVMDRLGEITAPVAVIVGERDKGFLASAGVFAKHLNVVSSTVVPEAGHMVHVKFPAAVATAIQTMVTR